MPCEADLISKEQIVAFLSGTELFSSLSKPILEAMAERCQVVYLAGEEILFNQNDPGDSLYVLMFGFVRASKADSAGAKKIIGELSAGSIIGEIAWLINDTRTATVYAVRDSVLLKISREMLDKFLEKYPMAMMGIARQSVKRLVLSKGNIQKIKMTCFALIPAGNFQEIKQFSQFFFERLSKMGKTLLLTQDTFDTMYGAGLALTALDSSKNIQITSWLHELETQYQFIVYVADQLNPWTYRCIRQVDRILLIAKYGENPNINEIEQFIFTKKIKSDSNVDLILLADDSVKRPTETHLWLKERNIFQHYPIKFTDKTHLDRLIRLLTGNAFALVLSGGGAPALAHIGLIRALTELKIPIDYIGGTSMGGLIGACFALGHDYQVITDMCDEFLNKFNAKPDYTLPLSSLLKGKLLKNLLQTAYGENTLIEDLWHKFFCVSVNLNKNELCVHESGPLWKAIRTTISLPAILPPMHDENNHLLVDGGILNNLPVDVMQSKINGGKIMASALKYHLETGLTLGIEDETTSGWYLFFKHYFLPKIWRNYIVTKTYPDIGSVISNSMVMSSNMHQKVMLEKADYKIVLESGNFGVLDFKPIRQIVEIGYQNAIAQLQKLDLSKR